VFRRIIVKAYDARCAITGLKLINGGGRAEVEAAHIRPVGANGPDTVQNGLALSGSFHTPPAAAAQDERVLMRSTAD
jgi:putative restriction endonuclease